MCDSIDGQERIRFDEFNLTEREGEVLHYLLLGKDARTIGDSLTVSVSTVKSHIYNIYRKLGVHSQREAIAMFEARGLACQLRTS